MLHFASGWPPQKAPKNSTWVTGELLTDQPRNLGRSSAVIILVVQHQAAGMQLVDTESASFKNDRALDSAGGKGG